MKKLITVKVYDKEDYFTDIGEWDEAEYYMDECGITEEEFDEIQQKVAEEDNIFSFEEEETDINEFLADIKNEDYDSKIMEEICELLWNMYNIQVTTFKVDVLSIEDIKK